MRTLADIKRRMVPGTALQVVNHVRPHISGPRTVAKVQTRDVAFDFPEGSRPANLKPGQFSWLSWPKSKDVRFDGPDAFTILDEQGGPFLSVTFDQATPAPAEYDNRPQYANLSDARNAADSYTGQYGGAWHVVEYDDAPHYPFTLTDDPAEYTAAGGCLNPKRFTVRHESHPAGQPLQAGDAVRLAVPWSTEPAGAIGVVGGLLNANGDPFEGGPVTFRARTFRGDGIVSCGGGPGTIPNIPAYQFNATGERTTLHVWRWNRYGRGAGNGEDYTVTVPLWDWHPDR